MISLSCTYNFEEKISKYVLHHMASQRFDVGTTCDSPDVRTVIELLPYPSQHILCDHGGGFLNSLLECRYITWQRRYIHMILYVDSFLMTTFHTVVTGIWSSRDALLIDFFGVLPNVSLTRWTFSSLTPGRPLLFHGHKQFVFTNFL
jgi:hypothetical protein